MSDYRDWQVGDRVVFVGYPGPEVFHADGKPVKRVGYLTVGTVYPILGICIRDHYAKSRWAGPSIHVGFIDPEHGQVWHHHCGFRKVQPRKTDIAIFTRFLKDADAPIHEEA